MRTAKGEAVSHFFTLGNNVVNIHCQVGKALKKIRVMFFKASKARTDAAGIAVMDHRIAVHRQISIDVFDFESMGSAPKRLNVLLCRHNSTRSALRTFYRSLASVLFSVA